MGAPAVTIGMARGADQRASEEPPDERLQGVGQGRLAAAPGRQPRQRDPDLDPGDVAGEVVEPVQPDRCRCARRRGKRFRARAADADERGLGRRPTRRGSGRARARPPDRGRDRTLRPHSPPGRRPRPPPVRTPRAMGTGARIPIHVPATRSSAGGDDAGAARLRAARRRASRSRAHVGSDLGVEHSRRGVRAHRAPRRRRVAVFGRPAGPGRTARKSRETRDCGAGGGSRTLTRPILSRLPLPGWATPARPGSGRPGTARGRGTLEAAGGFEPPSNGFADRRLNHLATPPCPAFPRTYASAGVPTSAILPLCAESCADAARRASPSSRSVVEPEAGDPRPRQRRLECRPDPTPPAVAPDGEHAPPPPVWVRLQLEQYIVDLPVDRDTAGLAALRLDEPDSCAGQVDALPLQSEDLALPHSGVEREYHHGGQAAITRRAAGLEQPPDLLLVEVAQPPFGHLRKQDFGHGVE